MRESSGRVNVWALCDEPPLFADNTNKTALKRQTESLKRLAEYLEKQRLLDLELKEVARTQRIAREKTLNQLARMGFSRDSCKKALDEAGPDVETAVAYLVANAATLSSPSSSSYTMTNEIETDKDTKEKNNEKALITDNDETTWRCSRCTWCSVRVWSSRMFFCDVHSIIFLTLSLLAYSFVTNHSNTNT